MTQQLHIRKSKYYTEMARINPTAMSKLQNLFADQDADILSNLRGRRLPILAHYRYIKYRALNTRA